ncbi:hypothetical protein MNBD_GAMMA10-3311 [hydrothermal vent metagenome]|uniref:FAD-binding domain-containing protein n=1 Tax=hydrothermal vent metagenome TaxID=652676 RepID=A0A3B0XVY0_9ZZZZ
MEIHSWKAKEGIYPESMKVCIIGGGLCGMSAALALRGYGIEVVLLEASNYERPRAGEHLIAKALDALTRLGVPARIWQANAVDCYEVQCAWGSEAYYTKNSIFNAQGSGVLLTRPGFDNALARFVAESGVDFRRLCRVSSLEKEADGWSIKYSTQTGMNELSADFIVDASGRNTKFSSSFDATRLKYDKLVAISLSISPEKIKHAKVDGGVPIGSIKVEAGAYGWCYIAGLKDGARVVTLMTDSHIVKKYGTPLKAFKQLLALTRNAAQLLNKVQDIKQVSICSSQTQILSCVAGDNWAAIGDAAWSADPLSSQGMYKAITSGINVADVLSECRQEQIFPAPQYSADIRAQFYKYFLDRSKYYRQERRWENENFWKIRHRKNWLELPVKLHPAEKIKADIEPDESTVQYIREIVPAVNVSVLLNIMTEVERAAEAVEIYKKNTDCFATDKEIVLAVQILMGL